MDIEAKMRKMFRAYAASDQWFQRNLPLEWRMDEATFRAIGDYYGTATDKVPLVGSQFLGIPIVVVDRPEILLVTRVVEGGN